MKIAFVIHDINKTGGQERSTFEIIERFSKNHEVHVFASSFADLNPSIQTHSIPVIFRKPIFFKDFFFRIFVSLRLAFEKFDVIHVTGNCSFIADIVTVQFCQKKWVKERGKLSSPWTIKTPLVEFQAFVDLLWETIVYHLLKNKKFIAISDLVAEDLRSQYGIHDIVVISHGVNFEEFKPDEKARLNTRERLGVKDEEILLLFVGTFERKGLFTLLPAFAAVKKNRNLKLCVVGSGPLARATAECSRLHILSEVLFVGHTVDVLPYYQAADLFVLPSYYDPFGLVGIEALASGLPSLISVQSGVSALITENKNGLLIREPSSIKEVSTVLELALAQRLEQRGRQAARLSTAEYSWDRIFPKYESTFNQSTRKKL